MRGAKREGGLRGEERVGFEKEIAILELAFFESELVVNDLS